MQRRPISRVGEPGFGQDIRLGPTLVLALLLLLVSPALLIGAIALAVVRPLFLYRWWVHLGAALAGAVLIATGAIAATLIDGWLALLTSPLPRRVDGAHDLLPSGSPPPASSAL
jgi:hypothetical protein